MAEALRAVEVWQALLQDASEDGVNRAATVRQWSGIIGSDQDAKAIAVQMARADLVRVPADAQDLDAVAVECWHLRFDGRRNGDHLAGDGTAILQPRGADLADRDVEPLGDLPLEILRPHVAFFDPEIEEVPLAARLISRDFLDLEIFGDRLDLAADAGEIGCQEGR